MIEYQPYMNVILSNLLCTVPLALLFIWTLGRDIFEVISRLLNPELPYLHWKDALPVPEKLQEAHDELIASGFVELGMYERNTLFNRLDYWCYYHPENPVVFVSMTNENVIPLIQFFTVFDDDEVITTAKGNPLNIDSDNVIINTVDGTVTETYQFHLRVVESEMARFGTAFEVTSIVAFTDMIKRAKNTHLIAIFRAYYLNSRGLMFLYWICASLIGIVGLTLIYSRQLTPGQANSFSNIVTGITLIGIIISVIFFATINRSVVQAQRKAKKLKHLD